jgi:plastocyanin
MVTIVDNDAPVPSRGIEAGTGYWGYGPNQLVVKKGEQVLFVNPTTNKAEHSVTSIANGPDGAFSGALAAGTKFDSSPTRPEMLKPGTSWTLDTANVDPGHYGYYCRFHTWMVGEITVLPE